MTGLRLLLMFLAEGLSQITYSGKEYHLIEEPRSWSEAWDYCRSEYTDLASVLSPAEGTVLDYLPVPEEGTWIGLYNDQQFPDGWKWTTGEQFSYSNWADSYPGEFSSSFPVCVYLRQGQWFDLECSVPLASICYTDLKKPGYAIPIESKESSEASSQKMANAFDVINKRHFKQTRFQPIVSEDRVYFLIEDEKSWTKAWNHCRSQYTNLVSVRNAEDARFIASLPHEPQWIGLYNDGLSGWMWSNGDKIGYTKWALWHPYSFNSTLPMCGAMLDGEWHEADCDFPFAFICYKDLKAQSEARPGKVRHPGKLRPPGSGEVLSVPKKVAASGASVNVGASSKRTYHKIHLEKTWSDARDYCMLHHTGLLSIRNKQENTVASRLYEEIKLGWCGLYNDQRTNSGWKWANGDPVGYTNWKPGNPYRYNIMAPVCVYIQEGRWSDAPCRFLFPFVCYTETSEDPSEVVTEKPVVISGNWKQPHKGSEKDLAADGAQDLPQPKRNYVLVNKEKTWSEAQEYCRAQHMDLVSVQHMTENSKVAKLLKVDLAAWIGLFNQHQSEYGWMWTNGEPATFFHWDPFYPMEFTTMAVCVILVNEHWKDVPCDYKFAFICYSEDPLASTPSSG
ncbi:macrophage mannose receptor 1-like [Chiloscyllium punctatum]|uniref:macrophage mannose receptor 1-like n=1 Tax=Chiloscyllium punctatum TaxID=137246 RepID=UPI003B63AFDB